MCWIVTQNILQTIGKLFSIKNYNPIYMQTSNNVLKNPSALLKAIVQCINTLIRQTPHSPNSQSIFNIKAAPTIAISDYLARMFRYMNASVSTFIYSLVLIDRAQEYNPTFSIHSKNIHRLLLISNVVSAKYLEDMFYKNSFYANVGGVSLKVLNELEIQFLSLINFNCFVESQTFSSYLQKIAIFIDINLSKENIPNPAIVIDESSKPITQKNNMISKQTQSQKASITTTSREDSQEHIAGCLIKGSL